MEKIDADKLQEGLNTENFGKKIVFLHEAISTNDFAKKLANYGADEGTVVFAEEQSAGKGRLGRTWISPRGGLYFSIILKPKIRVSDAVKLVFVASLAVAETIRDLYGLNTETKWPNDVLVDGKKVCGILAETSSIGERLKFVVLGIGINANFNVREKFPKKLQKTATSLQEVLDRKVDGEKLFKKLLEKLENFYACFLQSGFVQILEEWKELASFLGRQVVVLSGNRKWTGTALNVEKDGSLILKLEDGTVKRFLSGDVTLRVE